MEEINLADDNRQNSGPPPTPPATALSVKKDLKAGLLRVVIDTAKSSRPGSSPVWQIFGNVMDPANPGKRFEFLACSKCFHTYKVTGSAPTTNLLDHVKSTHPDIAPKNCKNSEADIDNPAKRLKSSNGIKGYLASGPLPASRKEKLDDAVLKLIVERCLPFECINSESFSDLVYTALNVSHMTQEDKEKVYKPLDESTFRKDRLPKKFERMQNAVKEIILKK